MSDVVLDASALLAWLQKEPGREQVNAILFEASMSAVNLTEVATRIRESGNDEAEIRRALSSVPVVDVSFDESQALEVGRLRPLTRRLGPSLGSRTCLALAKRLGLWAYTADRAWANLDLGIQVVVTR